jgi:hypothetical protein
MLDTTQGKTRTENGLLFYKSFPSHVFHMV